MDFLSFFGLREDPFKLTPDPAYFYPSSGHNEGLLLMDYSIDQKEGFLLIIGDPGTGKTTLLNVFLEKWKSKAEVAIILTPSLLPEEFLSAVAEDFNINIENRNKNEIIKALRDFMTMKSSEGKRVIIIVDEAQNLPDDTLEELRLLSNLETDKDKLLQIILLGQPELEAKLLTDNLRQLNQRISTRVHLNHFTPDETLDYINYRVIKAGKKNLQINKKAGRLAYRLSSGIPRLINMLISRALMAAFLEESSFILPRHINHAVKSLNHSDMKVKQWSRLVPVFAGSLAVVLLTAVIYLYLQNMNVKDTGAHQVPLIGDRSMEKKSDLITRENSGDYIPAFRLASVKVDVALIRNKPSIESKKAGWSLKGNQLVVLNESVDVDNVKWYQVPFQGEKRWISGEVVEIVDVDNRSEKGDEQHE